MAFTVGLYRDCLERNDVSGAGFDKVLQYAIVQRNLRIAYAPGAIVYDEKTAASDQLVNQRARWINTWFKYSVFGWRLLLKGMSRGSKNQFLFGIMLLRPPLFIFLILSGFFLFINIVFLNAVALWWLGAFLLFIGSFFIALSASHADKKIYDSLFNIPKFMWLQVQSLLKARGANKRSVATKHQGHDTTEDNTTSNEN
jgi:cellulose synthase/poly-beta-1,6-N-acetylglucosamine synthase-like glycosyltransferase